MYGSLDLQIVLRQQEALRRDAAQRRLAERIKETARSRARARRAVDLKPTFA